MSEPLETILYSLVVAFPLSILTWLALKHRLVGDKGKVKMNTRVLERDFEQLRLNELSCSEFCETAYQAINCIPKTEFRLRKNRTTKELFEEVLPLAAFAKYVETPGRCVKVQYAGGNDQYDGRVFFSGPHFKKSGWEEMYFVEVTTASSPKEHLFREVLEKDGHVHGGEQIEQKGSKQKGDYKIVSHPVVEYCDADIHRIADWCVEAINKKLAKSYPSPCILLVNICSFRKLNPIEWSEIIESVAGRISRGAFRGVFLVQPWQNIVLPAWNNSHGDCAIGDLGALSTG